MTLNEAAGSPAAEAVALRLVPGTAGRTALLLVRDSPPTSKARDAFKVVVFDVTSGEVHAVETLPPGFFTSLEFV